MDGRGTAGVCVDGRRTRRIRLRSEQDFFSDSGRLEVQVGQASLWSQLAMLRGAQSLTDLKG